jgi:HlyD family secretion protein
MKITSTKIALILLAAMMLQGCGINNGIAASKLSASGTIESKSISIAPEIGGVVSKVFTEEGSEVKAGDVLFRMDTELLQSQLDQASAAVTTAEVSLEAAQVMQTNTELQYQLTIQNARLQSGEALADEWRKSQPADFNLPVWYFTRHELITTAKTLVDKTAGELVKQEEKLAAVLKDVKNVDFTALEKELSAAQLEYQVADTAQSFVGKALESKEMDTAAEDAFKLKETQLTDIQNRYDQALDTQAAEDVLKARADVGVAQATYDEAVNQLQTLLIGDDSLQVQIGNATVKQAEKNTAQAEAGLAQAQASLKTIQIQLDKATVTSPISGVILAQNLDEGEMVGAGGTVMTVGNIDEVSLTVYIPEARYGQVRTGQEVIVKVDSYPEKTFMGTVSYIASEAEFTPSNVQTVEGRKSTVFAVKIIIPNTNHDLKPGMPADVEFILSK